MKKINNGFADQYLLDRSGNVYDTKSERWMIRDRNNYKLLDQAGKRKSISQKRLYELVYDQPFCIDEIEVWEGEVFKEIPYTEGKYYCSNLGRIKSYEGYTAKILKPSETKKGYLRVQIKQEGKLINKFVHSLVASVWLDKPASLDLEIHHTDFNKKNNRSDNLQYLTKIQHIQKHKERNKPEEDGKRDQNSTEPEDPTDTQRANKQTK